MALQFHPEYANLLAVGCYDGSVAVYDVRQKTNKPLYQAAAKAKKHSDTVWQVCWQVRPSLSLPGSSGPAACDWRQKD